MPDVVLLLQARLGSTRFPAKIVAPFGGLPMLASQVQRLRAPAGRLVVLVPAADVLPLEAALRPHRLPLYGVRGDPADVLGRYARFAEGHLAPGTLIVRACADCPLVCPMLLTAVLAQWAATPGLAYLGMGPGWPDGLGDYDVFTREALLTAHAEATAASDREHVNPYWWHHADRFPQALHPAPDWVQTQAWPKLSVDTPEDLAYVEAVAQAVQAAHGEAFAWWQVLETIARTPALQRAPEAMNAAYVAQVDGTTWQEVRYGSAG